MKNIHYFPRYSQKENTVTNNTLLLMSRLYNHSSEKFELFLNGLLEDEVLLNTVINFGQQDKQGDSIPDGIICQESFKVVIETKLSNKFSFNQIKNHLSSFDNEDKKIMLLLSPREPNKEFKNKVNDLVADINREQEENITLIYTTFQKIIDAFSDIIFEYNLEMQNLIDDFEDYCDEEKLLTNEEYRLRAVAVGKSFDQNLKHNIYYAPKSRSYRPHTYLGLYTKKAVRAIGKIKKVVNLSFDIEDKKITEISDDNLPQEERESISNMILEAYQDFGWKIYKDHNFFIVDKFYQTDFKKTSKYGLLSTKYFDLRKYLKTPLPETEIIADKLAQQTWI